MSGQLSVIWNSPRPFGDTWIASAPTQGVSCVELGHSREDHLISMTTVLKRPEATGLGVHITGSHHVGVPVAGKRWRPCTVVRAVGSRTAIMELINFESSYHAGLLLHATILARDRQTCCLATTPKTQPEIEDINQCAEHGCSHARVPARPATSFNTSHGVTAQMHDGLQALQPVQTHVQLHVLLRPLPLTCPIACPAARARPSARPVLCTSYNKSHCTLDCTRHHTRESRAVQKQPTRPPQNHAKKNARKAPLHRAVGCVSAASANT